MVRLLSKRVLILSTEVWLSRRSLTSLSQNFSPILGIETSCDDTAVCIMTNERNVLSSRRYSDRLVQARLGGICPSIVARQHRQLLNPYVSECLNESGLRLSDLGAVAVVSRPGLVLGLKAGLDAAISLARKGRLPLASVHHMQAHATMATFCDKSITFPFIGLLISGGHSIITMVHGPDRFQIMTESAFGSCGECIDKILRALVRKIGFLQDGHPGALLESLSSRCSEASRLRYCINMPPSSDGSFDFDFIRNAYISLLEKSCLRDDFNPEEFCASVEHCIAVYLANKLHQCLEYLLDAKKIATENRNLVLSGGVAANAYIVKVVRLLANYHGFKVFVPPPQLCTDNAEMIAWNGLLLFEHKSASTFSYKQLPLSIYAESRCPIGEDATSLVPRRSKKKLSSKHLAAGDIRFFDNS